MKNIAAKILLVALVAVMGVSVATPARADWYDRHHHWHGGYPPAGWAYSQRYGYYYAPRVVYAVPPPVIVSQPPQVVYAAPVYGPAPVYAEPGLSVGVHIR